jgi:dTDP-4-dehydrorhamnose 3,5-epimerase
MVLTETPLPGVVLVEPEPIEDERGLFARTFSVEQFARAGLETGVDQRSVSFNRRSGTLRGMHYQADPHGEAKLVRCTRGSLYDVALDLRSDSPTYLRWFGTELTAASRTALFVPEGCAHGFQTLEDATEVLYQISSSHVPDAARGVRWDDPAFGIEWPPAPAGGRTMSERDAGYPDFGR